MLLKSTRLRWALLFLVNPCPFLWQIHTFLPLENSCHFSWQIHALVYHWGCRRLKRSFEFVQFWNQLEATVFLQERWENCFGVNLSWKQADASSWNWLASSWDRNWLLEVGKNASWAGNSAGKLPKWCAQIVLVSWRSKKMCELIYSGCKTRI